MSDEKAEELLERRLRRRAARRGRERFQPDTSVPSPCISVCQVDNESGLCIGCLRNVDEIRDWIIMSAEEKHKVLSLIEDRKNPSA